jgi:hypothetical protein
MCSNDGFEFLYHFPFSSLNLSPNPSKESKMSGEKSAMNAQEGFCHKVGRNNGEWLAIREDEERYLYSPPHSSNFQTLAKLPESRTTGHARSSTIRSKTLTEVHVLCSLYLS